MTPNKYQLRVSTVFDKKLRKLLKFHPHLQPKVQKVLEQLATDPFYGGLRTHKAIIRNHGTAYSSRITGDIRVAWDFIDPRTIIVLLAIGGHDEVY